MDVPCLAQNVDCCVFGKRISQIGKNAMGIGQGLGKELFGDKGLHAQDLGCCWNLPPHSLPTVPLQLAWPGLHCIKQRVRHILCRTLIIGALGNGYPKLERMPQASAKAWVKT
ncbi:hypothetical protein ACA910_002749 [Epithemia clementina (nom. ined.)]